MYQTKLPPEQVLRLPLAGVYNTRNIDTSNSSFASTGVVGVGVVGVMIVGSSASSNKDQRYINAIPERITNPLTGAQSFYVSKRPGFDTLSTPSAGNQGTAIKVWSTSGAGTDVITAFGSTNSTLYKNTTSLGAITGTATHLEETIIGTASYVVAPSSDSTAWYYADDTGTPTQTFSGTTTSGSAVVTGIASTTGFHVGQALSGTGIAAGARILTVDSATQITMTANATASGTPTITRAVLAKIIDSDYPGNASRTTTGNFVFLDGYALIMDTSGRIYNSALNSLDSWGANDFLVAQMYPDKGVGLARYKNQIVAFGKETTEFFYNAGNETGSPLARTDQGFTKIGCVGQNAYVALEDTVAWVSASDISGIGLYVLDGLTPRRVSVPSIEAQLALVNSANIFVTGAKFVGKTFIVITTTSTTFVYVIEDDMWHEWSSTTPLWHHLTGTSAGSRLIYGISRTSTSGKLYYLNPSDLQYTDDGTQYTMLIQTSKFDADNSLTKFLRRIAIVGDKYSTTNTLNIVWTDDDYNTFSTARSVDLSSAYTHLEHCGSFRRRAFRITNSSDMPCRLEALELHVKQGIH